MTIKIDYYTDVLCIWAWIAERRQNELRKQFGDEIEFNYRYVNVFGDTQTRIGDAWESKGGFEGFGQHVIKSASPFDDAPVDAEIWKTVQPKSSMPAHTFLKAVELSHSAEVSADVAHAVRVNFFTNLKDIGRTDVLLDIAGEESLNVDKIVEQISSGAATAEIMKDLQMAQDQGIKGSPSWVLDGGRQILYGNVGYRVIRANATELLNQPQGEASWC